MPRCLGILLLLFWCPLWTIQPCDACSKCGCASCVHSQEPDENSANFIINDAGRWSRTALNESGLKQGDPTTLTWGIVPDGTRIVPRRPNEPDGPSKLRSVLDQRYGSSDAWFPLFEGVFSRWSELSGLTYLHEPNDDGQPISETEFVPGARGVRPDIRISGHEFGQSIFDAYNFFPENGDMVINTTSSLVIGTDPTGLLFRNLVAHENGHGLGLRHVSATNDQFLMESGISAVFEGPQFDDVLAVQRSYGDAWEKNGGNDAILKATSLGDLTNDMRITRGADAVHSRVFPNQNDFISIDGSSDVDFFSFRVVEPMKASIWLRPAGPSYLQGPVLGEVDGSLETLLDATRQSDLSLELYATDGRTLLSVARNSGLGGAELIDGVNLSTIGQYFVRVAGLQDSVQMYRLDIGDLSVVPLGDFDGNGLLDIQDLNALTDAVNTASNEARFDVSGDGLVNQTDRGVWVEDLRRTYFGDTNLDGEFTSNDLIRVFQANQYEDTIPGNSTWSTGDWDGDYDFTTGDLVLAFKAGGYEQGNRPSVAGVPEPMGISWLVYIMAGMMYRAMVRRT